jgi:hypothetical protein
MGLTVFSSFADSDDMDILKTVNFVEGNAFVRTAGGISTTVKAYIGLDYVSVRYEKSDLDTEVMETVFTWNDFCGNFTGKDSPLKAFESAAACQKCADASDNTASFMLYSLLGSIPFLITDVLRRYPNYDVCHFKSC